MSEMNAALLELRPLGEDPDAELDELLPDEAADESPTEGADA